MMKQLFSLMLSVLLCAGLTVPAFAVDYEDTERVRRIRISNSSMRMTEGESRQLTVTFTPYTVSDTLEWESSNDEVASVNDGRVTAHERGTAVIAVQTGGGLKASCKVTVEKEGQTYAVRSIEFSTKAMTVRVGNTRQLWPYFTPANVTDKEVAWFSSDNKIATVDEEGTVIGVAPGTAIISAEAHNGLTATCEVTVSEGSGTTASTTTSSSGEKLNSTTIGPAIEAAHRSTEKGKTISLTYKKQESVSAYTLTVAARTAQSLGRSVTLRFTSQDEEGKTRAFLALNPIHGQERTSSVKTGVFVDSETAVSVKNTFERNYTNKIAVIDCAHTGGFDMIVSLGAKADLTGMDKNNLKFYTYNASTKKLNELRVNSYRIDDSGYLRFGTAIGGTIIVSDGPLAKK